MRTNLDTLAQINFKAETVSDYFSVSNKQISFLNADPLKQDLRCENEVHCLLQNTFSSTIGAFNAAWIMGSALFSKFSGLHCHTFKSNYQS